VLLHELALALAAYVLLGLLVPRSTQSVQSLARFVMIAFPVCLALGLVAGYTFALT
jgi:hypothetical protein